MRSAFEFRHASWFIEEVYEAMRGANVALCQAESEKLETPDVQTADFAYLRLRKEDYSAQARKTLTGKVSDLAKKGDADVLLVNADGALSICVSGAWLEKS